MITVDIYRDSGGCIQGFTARGHAQMAPHGHDIVCAAVSAIGQTVIGSLQDLAKIMPVYELEDGNIKCVLPAETAFSQEQHLISQTLLAAMEIGCLQISLSYGKKYVRVRKKILNEGGASV